MERFAEVPVVHNSLVFFVLSSDVHSELNMRIWEKTYTETQPIIRPSVVHTTMRTRHGRYDFRPCTSRRREFVFGQSTTRPKRQHGNGTSDKFGTAESRHRNTAEDNTTSGRRKRENFIFTSLDFVDMIKHRPVRIWWSLRLIRGELIGLASMRIRFTYTKLFLELLTSRV